MEEKLKTVYEEILNLKLDDFSDLGKVEIDSLDFTNILFKVEEVFDISISNDDIINHKLEVAENLIQYLRENKKI